jgi:Fe-S oxidoreductase
VEGENQGLQERVKTFAARVMDVAEFLTQKIQLTPGEKRLSRGSPTTTPATLTGARGQLSTEEDSEGLPGVSLVEMRDPARCCGEGDPSAFITTTCQADQPEEGGRH